MLKFHKLFNGDSEKDSFHSAIEPTPEQRDFLVDAKNKIRDFLRAGIAAASVKVLGMSSQVEPRFRTQGSWSYKTCNRTAHQPPQEMDWDFGTYLPVAVWEDRPSKLAAKIYFQLVEGLLTQLCARQPGWGLITGAAAKDTCIRVKVASWAHVDVPLYAASEGKFKLIMEKALASFKAGRRSVRDSEYLSESAEFGELAGFDWEDLDEIVLATRSGEWKPSDPHAVSRWFLDRVVEHGEQLRRICRYLKAWRDYQWVDGGGPSSVLLMICAIRDFEARHGRDDLALEEAAARVAEMLKDAVLELGIDGGTENFNRLDPKERAEASTRAAGLRAAIRSARMNGTGMKLEALQIIITQLGPRFALRTDLVEVDASAGAVRATEAMPVAPPVVGSTISG